MITGTPEPSSHPLKYSSDKMLWVSPPGGLYEDPKRLYPRFALTYKAVPN